MDQIKIGEYIKKNRKEKKLTQQQLADILHTTNKAVSKWLRGRLQSARTDAVPV